MIIWYERLNPVITAPTTYLVHGGLLDGQVITEAEYHAIKDKAGTAYATDWGWLYSPLSFGFATGEVPPSNGDPLE